MRLKIPIYIDVLFVLNLFLNYFLLLVTARLSFQKISRLRFVFASLFGALYASIIFFLKVSFFILLLSKLSVALIITYISFLPKKPRILFHLGLIFLIIAILFGGVCYFISIVFSPINMAVNNFTVYFNFSPVLLIILTIIVYLVITLLEHFSNSMFLKESSYTVTISYNFKSCTLQGFMDNGNNLLDYFTNTPIVVCSFSSIEDLFLNEERDFFRNFSLEKAFNYDKKVRIVTVNTVSSSDILPAFIPQSFIVQTGDKKHSVDNVLIAVSNESSLKNKPIILNPKLLFK